MTKDTNPKKWFGMMKPSTHYIPPVAIMHLGMAMQDGATKYGKFNWRKDPVSASTYIDAAWRHWGAWADGEQEDPVSKCHHLAHAMACCAIILDAEASNALVDDRGHPGEFARLVREYAELRKHLYGSLMPTD